MEIFPTAFNPLFFCIGEGKRIARNTVQIREDDIIVYKVVRLHLEHYKQH